MTRAAPTRSRCTIPPGLFASFFKEALARRGIKVSGKVRSMNWLDRQVQPLDCGSLVELGSVESPPLREIAREVEKPSQNLYTDLLLAHVGEKFRGPDSRADETSEDLGIRELNKFLAEAGIQRGETIFEEGSGPFAGQLDRRPMRRWRCCGS